VTDVTDNKQFIRFSEYRTQPGWTTSWFDEQSTKANYSTALFTMQRLLHFGDH